jgi:hypothetical protein
MKKLDDLTIAKTELEADMLIAEFYRIQERNTGLDWEIPSQHDELMHNVDRLTKIETRLTELKVPFDENKLYRAKNAEVEERMCAFETAATDAARNAMACLYGPLPALQAPGVRPGRRSSRALNKANGPQPDNVAPIRGKKHLRLVVSR